MLNTLVCSMSDKTHHIFSQVQKRSRSHALQGLFKISGSDYLIVISTPNYPLAYNNGENKQWPIQAPAGQHIRFEFTDFSIEDHKTCGYDWVQVIDGNGQELLKKSCGDTKPKSFLSKTNKATVKFHSDGSTKRKGFRLEYSFKKDSQGGKKAFRKILKRQDYILYLIIFHDLFFTSAFKW